MASTSIGTILGLWGTGVDTVHATVDIAAAGVAVAVDLVTDVISFAFNPFGIVTTFGSAIGGKLGAALTAYGAVVDGIEETVDTVAYTIVPVVDQATDALASFFNPNGIFTDYLAS